MLTSTEPPAARARAAARYAKEHGTTVARAAQRHGCRPELAIAAWNEMYPAEPRMAVP